MFKLQKLEITGFKSFADYTEIVFTGAGITAVVGPNGCGKSNVADCITWVLGEQKAKNLRGGEMQDVIFAGTKTRPASGMAEVVLHLVRDESVFNANDNEIVEEIDAALNDFDDRTIDFEDFETSSDFPVASNGNGHYSPSNDNGHHVSVNKETVATTTENKLSAKRKWNSRRASLDFAPNEAISIARRLYRSGESEYLLNGRACRLRDIQDLFAGTGLGGGHYALVQQEKISQILSAKPADRRTLIEEAAGISKFRTRQRAAEIRLESAKNNLRRISDIVSEVDKQANSLRRQAARTRRYQELQEILRESLKTVFTIEGRILIEDLANLRQELTVAIAAVDKSAANVRLCDEKAKTATQMARQAEENLAALRQAVAEAALRRERLSRDLLHQSEQITDFEARRKTLETEISKIEDQLRVVSADAARLREKNQESSVLNDADNITFKKIEDDYNAKISLVKQLEDEVERFRQAVLQHTTAAERLGGMARQQSAALEKISERAEGLEREGERAVQTLVERQRDAAELSDKITIAKQNLIVLQNNQQQAEEKTHQARQELQACEKAWNQVKEEINVVKAQRETLAGLDNSNAMLAPAVQKLFAAQNKINVKLLGTLADFVQVERRFERAVETAFGAHLQAVVVEDKREAEKIFEWLKTVKNGNIAVLVRDTSTTKITPGSNANPKIIDLLGATDEPLRSNLHATLPQIMNLRVVEHLAEANDFPAEDCVTQSGEVVFHNQFFIFTAQQEEQTNGKNNLLSFKRELRELVAREQILQTEFAASSDKTAAARDALQKQEKIVAELQAEINLFERELMSFEVNAKSLQQEIERAERHTRVVSDEKKQLKTEQADFENKRFRFEADAEIARNEQAAAAQKLAEITIELTAARNEAERANADLSERRAHLAAASERRRSLANALRRVESEQLELRARAGLRQKEFAEVNSKLRNLRGSLAQLEAQTNSIEHEKKIEVASIDAAFESLQTARAQADRATTELTETNLQASKTKDARAALEVAQAEISIKLENLHDLCRQELNQSLSELLNQETKLIVDLKTEKRCLEDLREKIENFGAVNLLAVEELSEIEERLLFLTSQRQDIVDSIEAAEDALEEIKHRSRERFMLAFAEINRNFMQLFAEIFGGGRGEMNLLDAGDVLESGIEIVAQPPGKRLQNLLLLSGGEKAMTAIALVLAIFRFQPAPFCLLDEVDAPLDEANVGRFVEKVRQMSQKTQFIVITHNKRTMEAARALYGVTMEEAGVSKVVSVKFE